MTAPRTYTVEKYWVAGSQHPDAIAALKAKAKAEGAELGPPWLPSDEGVLYGTVKTTTPPRYRPPRHTNLPVRTTPSPGRWSRFALAVALAIIAGAAVGLTLAGYLHARGR